jgi:hypothetical protein
MSKQIISFGLWNSQPTNTQNKYIVGAFENIKLQQVLMPSWSIYFYVDDSISEETQRALIAAGSTVINVTKLPEYDRFNLNEKKMYWRWLALLESFSHIIFRDTDSRISKREVIAINEWIESNKSFHIIRDHYEHTYPIMGGMWGVKQNVLDLHSLLEQTNKNEYKGVYMYDQLFLRNIVYPLTNITNRFIHDELIMFETSECHKLQPRENYEFIGEIYDEANNRADHYKYFKLNITIETINDFVNFNPFETIIVHVTKSLNVEHMTLISQFLELSNYVICGVHNNYTRYKKISNQSHRVLFMRNTNDILPKPETVSVVAPVASVVPVAPSTNFYIIAHQLSLYSFTFKTCNKHAYIFTRQHTTQSCIYVKTLIDELQQMRLFLFSIRLTNPNIIVIIHDTSNTLHKYFHPLLHSKTVVTKELTTSIMNILNMSEHTYFYDSAKYFITNGQQLKPSHNSVIKYETIKQLINILSKNKCPPELLSEIEIFDYPQKQLLVEHNHGLCNRLNNIIYSRSIQNALMYHCKVNALIDIIWKPTNECECNFEDYFCIKPVLNACFYHITLNLHTDITGSFEVLSPGNNEIEKYVSFQPIKVHKSVHTMDNLNPVVIRHSLVTKEMKPNEVPELQTWLKFMIMYEQDKYNITSQTPSVHIRGTDMIDYLNSEKFSHMRHTYIPEITTNNLVTYDKYVTYFINQITQLYQTHNVPILVVTDDESIKRLCNTKLANKVIMRNISDYVSYTNQTLIRTQKQVYQAIIDLYLLSDSLMQLTPITNLNNLVFSSFTGYAFMLNQLNKAKLY